MENSRSGSRCERFINGSDGRSRPDHPPQAGRGQSASMGILSDRTDPAEFPAAAEPRLKRLTRRTRSIGLAAGRDRAPAANPPGLPDCKAPFTRLGRPDSRSSHGYPSMALSPCCTLPPPPYVVPLRSADLRPPGGSHLPLSRALRIAGSGEATCQRDREARQRTTAAHRRPGPCMTILRITGSDAAPNTAGLPRADPLRCFGDRHPCTGASGPPFGRRSGDGACSALRSRPKTSAVDWRRARRNALCCRRILSRSPAGLRTITSIRSGRWSRRSCLVRARRDQAASGRRVAAVRLTDTGSAARIADHGRAPARQRALVALANAPGQTLAMTALVRAASAAALCAP